MSVPNNREHHYRNLRDRYTNCTYVDGNLELTWLQDENLDLDFLKDIREVSFSLCNLVIPIQFIFRKLNIFFNKLIIYISGYGIRSNFTR